jgi:hypothetical protein
LQNCIEGTFQAFKKVSFFVNNLSLSVKFSNQFKTGLPVHWRCFAALAGGCGHCGVCGIELALIKMVG